MPPCPILFIGLNSAFSKGQIEEYLGLEKLKEFGDVSWYEILLIESDTGAAELHQQVTGWTTLRAYSIDASEQ